MASPLWNIVYNFLDVAIIEVAISGHKGDNRD